MANRFVPDKAGIAASARTSEMALALRTLGEKVKAHAQSIGPKDDTPNPHYVDDITVDTGVEGPTMIARVNANKFTSHWIEFGTGAPGPTPAFAPLRRGAEAAGLVVLAGAGRDRERS